MDMKTDINMMIARAVASSPYGELDREGTAVSRPLPGIESGKKCLRVFVFPVSSDREIFSSPLCSLSLSCAGDKVQAAYYDWDNSDPEQIHSLGLPEREYAEREMRAFDLGFDRALREAFTEEDGKEARQRAAMWLLHLEQACGNLYPLYCKLSPEYLQWIENGSSAIQL